MVRGPGREAGPERVPRYARAVAESQDETETTVALPRKAVLFGPRNPDDKSTRLSTDELVAPLAKDLAESKGVAAGWDVKTVLAEEATKDALRTYLGGAETPTLLFTASHGLGFPNGHPRQLAEQGALVCQDWPGPLEADGEIVADSTSRPTTSPSFGEAARADRVPLRLLRGRYPPARRLRPQPADGHPGRDRSAPVPGRAAPAAARPPPGRGPGGDRARRTGLGLLVHVEPGRAPAPDVHLHPSHAPVRRPGRVGHRFLNQRYAELSSDLSVELEEIQWGKVSDDLAVAGMWTANNDARSFIILGDPAARLPLAAGGSKPRPTLEPVVLSTSPPRQTPPRRSRRPRRPQPRPSPPGRPAARRPRLDPGFFPGGAGTAGGESTAMSVTRPPLPPPGPPAWGGEVTFTIPLQVTIRFGQPVVAGAIPVVLTTPAPPPAVVDTGSDELSFAAAYAAGISIDPKYGNREGYDPDFLGSSGQRVPLPTLTAGQQVDAARLLEPDAGSPRTS